MAKQTASSPHRNVRKRPGNTHAARSPRSRSAPWDDAYGVPVPRGLHEAIEVERDNLSKAHSLLGCLALSMEAEPDPVSGPYYPDIARLARDMVKQSINGLDVGTRSRTPARPHSDSPAAAPCIRCSCSGGSSIRSACSNLCGRVLR